MAAWDLWSITTDSEAGAQGQGMVMLWMYDDRLCMSVGMLCMNIGTLCMNVGMLCMSVSTLCMNVAMLCMNVVNPFCCAGLMLLLPVVLLVWPYQHPLALSACSLS